MFQSMAANWLMKTKDWWAHKSRLEFQHLLCVTIIPVLIYSVSSTSLHMCVCVCRNTLNNIQNIRHTLTYHTQSIERLQSYTKYIYIYLYRDAIFCRIEAAAMFSPVATNRNKLKMFIISFDLFCWFFWRASIHIPYAHYWGTLSGICVGFRPTLSN